VRVGAAGGGGQAKIVLSVILACIFESKNNKQLTYREQIAHKQQCS